MTDITRPRLTLRQRWHRLRTSHRFPFLLFFGLLAAGGLSQVNCYWWGVRVEQMLIRNSSSAERIEVFPLWVKKYVGAKMVRPLEPVRVVRFRLGSPLRLESSPDDLRLLRRALFLRELHVAGELTSVESIHLSRLTPLRIARFWAAPQLAVDGVKALPRLGNLGLVFDSSTDLAVYESVASMSQLKQFSCRLNKSVHGVSNVELGFPALAKSQSIHRLDIRPITDEQLFALTSLLSDGSPPLPELRELRLRGSVGLTDRGLVNLGHLSNLVELDLERSHITDDGLVQLRRLPCLRTLCLESCLHITDEGLMILATMHNLESVNVRWAPNVTGQGVLRLATLPRLRFLCASYMGPQTQAELRNVLPAGCELDTN